MSSPRLLRKLSRFRPFRVLLLGCGGVGKTAMTVRFITRRFIGEYDPTLEKKYTHQTDIDEEQVAFEIFDTAGQELESLKIDENIRWADAFLLIYDITDRCSFEECTRLKFLINYAKKPRRSGHSGTNSDFPVFMVGNKSDLVFDRMVHKEDAKKKSSVIGCSKFFEISVRESCEEVISVFHELYKAYRDDKKPKAAKHLYTKSLSSGTSQSVDDGIGQANGGSDRETEKEKFGRSRKPTVQMIIRRVRHGKALSRQEEVHAKCLSRQEEIRSDSDT